MSKAPAVDYALQIIKFFADSDREIGISDICNDLHINKNAASRVLDALMEQQWIYLSNSSQKKYRLTMKPFSLLTKSVERNGVAKISMPHLKKIHDALGDSVYLGVKKEDRVIYELHLDSVKDVRINGCVGGEYPLHCSAPGKVLLSYGDIRDMEAYYARPIERRSEHTIVTIDAFMQEAERIRADGYALDNEEFARGIICVACPIFDSDGKVIASIGISSLTIYDSIASLIDEKYPLLKKAARNISLELGYGGEDLP